MKISTVVPSYNRGHLISETIEAILAQTRPVDEILVVDDGSTDETVALLKEKFAETITLLERENGGPEAAREQGIRAAGGDWIALCDSDDIWQPTHIEGLLNVHQKFPEARLLFSNFEEFGSTATALDKFSRAPEGFWPGGLNGQTYIDLRENLFPRLLQFNPVFPSATMFTRDLFEEAGGINLTFARMLAADADLTRRCSLVTTFACHTKSTVKIRKDGHNFSSESSRTDLGRISILLTNLEAGGVFAPYEQEIRDAITKSAIDVMNGAFANRDFVSFKEAANHVQSHQLSAWLKFKSWIAGLPGPARSLVFALYRPFT